MFFRNLTLFRFPLSLVDALQTLPERAGEHALRELTGHEQRVTGFVSPFGRESDQYTHQVGKAMLFQVGSWSRSVPASVVADALEARIGQIQSREGRAVGGRERKRLKDEVLVDLLPRAFSLRQTVSAYLDLARGWLVIDTASKKAAEMVVTQVREALGSFPVLPVNAESSPRALLTAWLTGETLPADFALGEESELRDPVEKGAVVKLKRQELTADEVQEHLRAGKQGFQLAMTFDERVSFVASEDLVVRKLKFLEVVTQGVFDEVEDRAAELDAGFALLTGEVGRLLDRLGEAFQLSEAS